MLARRYTLNCEEPVYDANFAYRLSCTLRNAAQHMTDILNYVSYTSSESSPGGLVTTRVSVGIDGPRLIASGAELKAGERDELADASEPLMVERFLDGVMRGCEYLSLWWSLARRRRSLMLSMSLVTTKGSIARTGLVP